MVILILILVCIVLVFCFTYSAGIGNRQYDEIAYQKFHGEDGKNDN